MVDVWSSEILIVSPLRSAVKGVFPKDCTISVLGDRMVSMVRCYLVCQIKIAKGPSRSTDGMSPGSQYTDPTLGLECIPGQASTGILRESGIKGMASVHRAEAIQINVDVIQALPIVSVDKNL